jgi:hypothetical protein
VTASLALKISFALKARMVLATLVTRLHAAKVPNSISRSVMASSPQIQGKTAQNAVPQDIDAALVILMHAGVVIVEPWQSLNLLPQVHKGLDNFLVHGFLQMI